MFTEKDLLQKIRGNTSVNFSHNMKNTYQKECYCNRNEELHKKDSCFDMARRTNLAENYFGSPKDPANHLLAHTKKPEEATLMRTYNAISQNIATLHDIGERKPSSSSSNALSRTNFHLPREVAQPSTATTGVRFTHASRTASAGGMSRVFSPKDSCYINVPTKLENDSLKLTYMSMRCAHNINSIQVCGTKTATDVGRPFEHMVDAIKNAKPYTVSAETFQHSWIDRGRPQTTNNYESAKFNIINHSYGQNASITALIKDNPKACYKVKGIAEYCDLARVSAIKQNHEYQEKIKANPTCFLKAGAICAAQCDVGKSYGPCYKLFKK